MAAARGAAEDHALPILLLASDAAVLMCRWTWCRWCANCEELGSDAERVVLPVSSLPDLGVELLVLVLVLVQNGRLLKSVSHPQLLVLHCSREVVRAHILLPFILPAGWQGSVAWSGQRHCQPIQSCCEFTQL